MAPRIHDAAHQLCRTSQCSLGKTSHCAFSTSSICLKVQKTNPLRLLPKTAAPPPPYPYGSSHFYKQRDTGLYGGVMIQFGNNVAPRSAVKTRRSWTPNVVHKKMYSAALDRNVTLKVATRVLRTIDKVGGLDEYLLGTTSARLKELGEEGWKLKWAILQAPSIQERMKSDVALRSVANFMGQMAENKVQQTEIMVEGADGASELEVKSDVDVEDLKLQELEDRIQRNMAVEEHMNEEPPPKNLLQRLVSPITRLLGR